MKESDIIKKNFNEYLDIAKYSFKNRKFNAAVTLYYKALVELCDLVLFEKTDKIGANHTERFKLLEQFEPILYNIASKLFKFYRDSYNKEISETIAKIIKENVENAKEKYFKNKDMDKKE
ncbi:hypothetical protein HY498_02115 [Candidatus Woesearchaeota archaeon]|nr:hypothetical protein [Candidatus Woesearchaeota archaeon]